MTLPKSISRRVRFLSAVTLRLAAVLCAAAGAGCATHADYLNQVRYNYYTGDLDTAMQQIERGIERDGSDKDVLLLDRALVDLCTNHPRRAEQTLREIRDRFDYLEQKSAGEDILSMLSDANAKAYAGEDYEKVLIRAMLAMTSLVNGGDDALAYSLQINQKQQQIIQAAVDKDGNNPKADYKQIALGPYLHGILREQTHVEYGEAARAYATVVSWQPDFQAGQADLNRAQYGHHSAQGNGVLYVFTLVGRGPYKEETIEIPSTVALLIAGEIISHNAEHTLPPNIAPIKVPVVVETLNDITSVQLAVDDQTIGTTETITDVTSMAVHQFAAVRDRIVAEAVVRRIVKKGVVYGAKEILDSSMDNPLLNFGMDAAGVVWEASEAADTRCWGVLPDKIQVLRVELPAGTHRLSLAPTRNGYTMGQPASTTVEIEDGRNCYVLANFPGNQLVGKILSSSGPGPSKSEVIAGQMGGSTPVGKR